MVWLPQPLSWGCDLTVRGGRFDHHRHDHDEICLVANDGSTVLHAGREHACAAGTAFLFRAGEPHGYRNARDQQPHLWLVHFRADPGLERECPRLADADPARRVWVLDADRQAAWQAVFQRLMAESLYPRRPGHQAAASAWLRLLLVQAARWELADAEPAAVDEDPGLARIWEVINQHIEAPGADFGAALARHIPNYDSLRHRFRRRYGSAPRDLLARLRIERAKHLLLETGLPVAAVAGRLGYARAAEFARAFARATGRTPRDFRADPSLPVAAS
jgi:transcriptional regulator GlxA family with amidase domain